jgi:hypothetical protein
MLHTFIKLDELQSDPVSLKHFILSNDKHLVVFKHYDLFLIELQF